MEEFDSLRLRCLLEADQISLENGERIGIGTMDLVDFAQVVDAVSTAIAERAVWSFLTRQGLREDELAAAIDHSVRRSRRRWGHGRADFAPGQVSRVENGSVEIVVLLVGSMVISWAARNLVGEAVVAGWKESVGREKLKNATRGLFGGAAEAAQEVVEEEIPPSLTSRGIAVEPAAEPGSTREVVLRLGKARSPELAAWNERSELLPASRDSLEGEGPSAEEKAQPDWRVVRKKVNAKEKRKAKRPSPKREREQGA